MVLKLLSLLFLLAIELQLSYSQYSQQRDGREVQRLLGEIRRETYKKLGISFDKSYLNTGRQQLRANQVDDGTEAFVNRNFAQQLFEDDIVLTSPQARSILNEIKRSLPLRSHSRTKGLKKRISRQIHPDPTLFWQSTWIPYRFAYNNSYWQESVRAGIRHVEQHTCFRFIENGTGRDYLNFYRARGCYSSIGRVGGGQVVSIGRGCDHLGIVAHEIGHALGLWHEQSRTDRDRYVTIKFDNILKGMEYNFHKRTPETSANLGKAYDLGSLMHYGPTDFTKSYDSYTITSNDPRYQRTIGNRMGLSFKDSKMINTRYCSNICKTKLACKNGGYTDPNNCRQCRCPDAFGGTFCDQLAVGNVPSCGGLELNADVDWQSIQSPNLTSNMRCYWRIRSPVGERLALYVQNISFPCQNACRNFVEVKYTHDKTLSGARFCCETDKKPFLSDNNEVLVILRTSAYVSKDYTGFELFYKKHGSNLYKKKDKLKKEILS